MFVRKRQAILKQVWSSSGRIPWAWPYSNLESWGRPGMAQQSKMFFTKIWGYQISGTTMTSSTSAQKSKFLNNYQIFFKEFDENSLKTFTGWAANSIETRRLKVLSFSALLQSFALEQCFDLFYIIFSWMFLEFRNWNVPKNAKKASRTDRKLCVSIQRSCDLEQKWPMFVWVSVGVTFLWHRLCLMLL